MPSCRVFRGTVRTSRSFFSRPHGITIMRYPRCMAKDDEKTLRQLSLLSFLLDARRPVATREVMESVEGYATMTPQAFKKRFFDDREDLREAGINIERLADPRLGTGEAFYLSREDYRLPDLSLSAEEYSALVWALIVLQDRFPYEKPLRLALAALGEAQGLTPAAEAPSFTRRITVGEGIDDSEDVRARLARLENAWHSRKTVRFTYHGVGAGEPGERVVDPYGLFLVEGHWYVVGHDHDRAALRMFRVDRIRSKVHHCTKKPHDFPPPTAYDPEQFTARPPWLIGEAVGEADILVDPQLDWWVSRTYRRHIAGSRQVEDGTHYTLPYADPDPLLAWVVTWRRHVRLAGPADLVERLRNGLCAAIALHMERVP